MDYNKAKHPSNFHHKPETSAKATALYQRAVLRYRANTELSAGAFKFSDYAVEERGILNAKPRIAYWHALEGKRGPLMGVELEIEEREGEDQDPDDYDEDNNVDLRNLAWGLKPLNGNYFICEDGSLRVGCEVVFQPMSLQGWRALYLPIRKSMKLLSERGFISHESGRCGLHVHVSRDSLGVRGYNNAQAKRVSEFVLRHSDLFSALSRRECFNYCKFQPGDQAGRYAAVNLQPEHTIEFRFFRGTLIPSSFFGALETVAALNEHFISDRRSYTFAGFLKTLRKYPHAVAYCTKRVPDLMTKAGRDRFIATGKKKVEAVTSEQIENAHGPAARIDFAENIAVPCLESFLTRAIERRYGDRQGTWTTSTVCLDLRFHCFASTASRRMSMYVPQELSSALITEPIVIYIDAEGHITAQCPWFDRLFESVQSLHLIGRYGVREFLRQCRGQTLRNGVPFCFRDAEMPPVRVTTPPQEPTVPLVTIFHGCDTGNVVTREQTELEARREIDGTYSIRF